VRGPSVSPFTQADCSRENASEFKKRTLNALELIP
jgi:hypothetical protein